VGHTSEGFARGWVVNDEKIGINGCGNVYGFAGYLFGHTQVAPWRQNRNNSIGFAEK